VPPVEEPTACIRSASQEGAGSIGPAEEVDIWTLTLAALAATPDAADSVLQAADAPVALRLRADLGALAQISHRLQIGADGTEVQIPSDLGQDVLVPYTRLQLDLDLGRSRRHTVALLYQPLDLRSEVAPTDDLVVGDRTFAAGRSLRFRYSFPYWRTTWLYDLAPANDTEVAVGLALQIRNANIVYAAVDGSQVVSSRNIGPVPLLAFRSRGRLAGSSWIGAEMQGFWAPIRLINGSTNDVEGLIADGCLQWGLSGPKGAEAYLALRYVGGGAVGTSSNPDPYQDGYTKNWLHLGALSVGAALR